MASSDGLRRPRRRFLRSASAALLLCLASGCGGGGDPTLDVDSLLQTSPQALIERWGEPDISIRKSPSLQTLQWRDLEGTWVFVACVDERVRYVTYTFNSMEPFAADKAFRVIGLEPPGDEVPEHEWPNGGRRWLPFRQYAKLTLNPTTKAITVSLDAEPPALGE